MAPELYSEASNDKPNYQYGVHSLDDNSLMKAALAELVCGKPIGKFAIQNMSTIACGCVVGFYFPLNGFLHGGMLGGTPSHPFE